MGLLAAESTFQPYGTSHWALITLIVVGSLALALAGRRHPGAATARPVRRGFAVLIVVLFLPLLVYRLLPDQWNLYTSLPLHLCDLAWMAAAHALWTGRRWAGTLTYYWGLTLTPQAMATPALNSPDFPHIDFLEFWAQHLLVVWAAVYLTWVVGLRPGWRDYRRSLLVTLTWMAALLVVNAALGTNYGFLNAKPDNPSMLDLLGGWPWYLGVEVALGAAAWALLTWPWTHRARRATIPPATGRHRERP